MQCSSSIIDHHQHHSWVTVTPPHLPPFSSTASHPSSLASTLHPPSSLVFISASIFFRCVSHVISHHQT
ncbi:MAG: hypothetical protein Q8P67_11660 [archaeon]|nr:hypothetical protein [archaeon]